MNIMILPTEWLIAAPPMAARVFAPSRRGSQLFEVVSDGVASHGQLFKYLHSAKCQLAMELPLPLAYIPSPNAIHILSTKFMNRELQLNVGVGYSSKQ